MLRVSSCCEKFSSVGGSCPTLCDRMNRSTPGLPIHHQLPESTQTHVHWVKWCHPTISSSVIAFSSCPQSFPASGSFPMSQLFASGGQSIGVSASASVLPVNTQDWSPLGREILIGGTPKVPAEEIVFKPGFEEGVGDKCFVWVLLKYQKQ